MNTKLNMVAAFVVAICYVGLKQTSHAAVPDYVLVDLGAVGDCYAYGINNNGQVVGQVGWSPYTQPFLWSSGTMEVFGTDSWWNSEARGINDKGQVVGSRGSSGGAFLYSNGVLQDVGSGSSWMSSAYGINDDGQIVGGRYTNGYKHAVLYSNGSIHDLGTLGGLESSAYGINNIGQIVGWASIANGDTHAFKCAPASVMEDLGTLGGVFSIAYSINSGGQVVGESTLNGYDNYRAFLYSNGSMKNLGTVGTGDYSIAYGINSKGQVVGTSTIAELGDQHPFLYSEGVMYDLSDLVVNRGTWLLFSATAINESGQIAGWGVPGQWGTSPFLLNPLPIGWRQAIEAQPVPPTYGICPNREAGKDNLIVVTHGWIAPWDTVEESTGWVDDMVNSITRYLTSHGLNNWQVVGYKWVEKANTGTPQRAIENGKEEGKKLGECLAVDRWTHIHLIAHSAGSALIQATTDVIKDPANGSSATIVHETFLDPFVGFDRGGVAWYGAGANWADNYFARDILTGGEAWQFTEGPLEHAYNVDVTRIDGSPKDVWTYLSTPSGFALERCSETLVSSHGWPVDFYLNTILPSTQPDSEGFGFPLSKEGGNWAFALANYPPGVSSLKTLKPPLGSNCGQGLYQTTPAMIGPKADFTKMPVIKNDPARAIIHGIDSVALNTGSPAWLVTFVTLTNNVNLVSLDTQFESTNGARGLLTVYWDTNIIGSIDEQTVQQGLQHYLFKFPSSFVNSTHMLGFRLDPFTNIQSSAIVTNITLGFVGVNQPFMLSATTNVVDSLRVFQLTGQSGFTYTVEASTNLVNWNAIALLVNTNGVVRFVDIGSSNAPQRFYRAVAPY